MQFFLDFYTRADLRVNFDIWTIPPMLCVAVHSFTLKLSRCQFFAVSRRQFSLSAVSRRQFPRPHVIRFPRYRVITDTVVSFAY